MHRGDAAGLVLPAHTMKSEARQFGADGEKGVERMGGASPRGAAAGLALPAHTMKSEARQFGAEPLGALAEEIEMRARQAVEMRTTPEDMVPQVARLRPLYRDTMALLEAEANPLRQRRAPA